MTKILEISIYLPSDELMPGREAESKNQYKVVCFQAFRKILIFLSKKWGKSQLEINDFAS